jgi:hypothetical protein
VNRRGLDALPLISVKAKFISRLDSTALFVVLIGVQPAHHSS